MKGGRSESNRVLYHAIINRFFPFKHSLAVIQQRRPPASEEDAEGHVLAPKSFSSFLPREDRVLSVVARIAHLRRVATD